MQFKDLQFHPHEALASLGMVRAEATLADGTYISVLNTGHLLTDGQNIFEIMIVRPTDREERIFSALDRAGINRILQTL